MAFDIDNASDHVDLFDRLIAFLQLGSTTPGGPDWTLLRHDTDANSALFMAPGMGGTEEIFVGVNLNANAGADAYALGFWMFRAYNEALDDLAQPGYSGIGYLPIWNAAMPYWFIANGQRLIITTKVSTVYSSSYVGKILPYGVPGEYSQPYFVGNTVPSATTRWSTVDEGNRNFWDPGSEGNLLLPNGVWRTVQNFQDISGESDTGSTIQTWPFQGAAIDGSTKTEYRKLRENLDGTYPLWPIVIHGSNPANEIYGEFDGVYAVSGFNNASENIIEIDGFDYVVFQNLFRTERYYYAAHKLE